MKKYQPIYTTRYNFLKWCQYWLQEGCVIHHTSWKPNYPKIKHIEYNSEELIKKHSHNKYMHKTKEYFGICDDDRPFFFDRSVMKKGEWTVKSTINVDDLFE